MKISTSTRSGPSNATGVPSSRAFIAGITERGSLTPLPVRSIVEYSTAFGTNQSYCAHMYRAATTFFQEGGSELVVCRAVGPVSTIGTHTFKDRTVGTALDTMTVTAADPGAWSAGLTIRIEPGRVANSVTVSAFLAGVRVTFVRDKTTVADIVTATATDIYIRVTDMGPASVYPTRLPALTVVGVDIALSAGDDKRGTLLEPQIIAALNNAGNSYGAGAVAAPGYYADIIGTDLIAHCQTHRRVAILAGQVDDTVADLSTSAASLTLNGEYAGLFAPWLTIPEGTGFAKVSPEGYVLGVRGRVMNAQGFWQAVAGQRATALYVQDTVIPYDPNDIDTLADASVSGITQFGTNTVLYGYRSLSANTDQYYMLTARDFLNALTELVETTLRPFIFETIDGTGQLTGRIKGALVGILQPIEDAGGITAKFNADGSESNPAYRVDVVVLDETTLSATLVVRLSGTAETIQVSIIKAAFTASV